MAPKMRWVNKSTSPATYILHHTPNHGTRGEKPTNAEKQNYLQPASCVKQEEEWDEPMNIKKPLTYCIKPLHLKWDGPSKAKEHSYSQPVYTSSEGARVRQAGRCTKALPLTYCIIHNQEWDGSTNIKEHCHSHPGIHAKYRHQKWDETSHYKFQYSKLNIRLEIKKLVWFFLTTWYGK